MQFLENIMFKKRLHFVPLMLPGEFYRMIDDPEKILDKLE